MPSDFGLTVRRHERHALSLSALVSIGAHPAPLIGGEDFGGGRVRFSPESGVSETGMRATIVDVGAGGVGFRSAHFLPRGAVLRVRILSEGTGASPQVPMDATVRVQRVTMLDRGPTYLYGTSFIEPSAATLRAVDALTATTGGRAAAC